VDWVKKHPAISDHTIEPPVVITGVPGADLCGVRDRIAATRSDWPAATRLLATEARSGDQARPSPSTGPGDELFDITFRSLDFESALRVDRYRDALASSDFAAAYELHRVQLQILDAAHPGERRLVAGSEHLFAPHDLADAYPGAVVVLVDVDPDLALRRMVDQSSRRRGWFSDRVDEDCITGQWRRRIAELAGLVDPARDVLADRAFIVDVDDRSDFAGLFAAVR
ncbi:MAG: hypothetical protein OEU32_20125, partial [Acidimicrobiia bacterium]|nr:hypothetical protein [Acidimicrobiia bacterium]